MLAFGQDITRRCVLLWISLYAKLSTGHCNWWVLRKQYMLCLKKSLGACHIDHRWWTVMSVISPPNLLSSSLKHSQCHHQRQKVLDKEIPNYVILPWPDLQLQPLQPTSPELALSATNLPRVNQNYPIFYMWPLPASSSFMFFFFFVLFYGISTTRGHLMPVFIYEA